MSYKNDETVDQPGFLGDPNADLLITTAWPGPRNAVRARRFQWQAWQLLQHPGIYGSLPLVAEPLANREAVFRARVIYCPRLEPSVGDS